MSNYKIFYNEIINAVEEFEPYEDFSVEDYKCEKRDFLDQFRDRIFFGKMDVSSQLIDEMFDHLEEWVDGWGVEWRDRLQMWSIKKYVLDNHSISIDVDDYNHYVIHKYGFFQQNSKKFVDEYLSSLAR